MTNRLAQETSPHLLQHDNDPVDWYPWGEEAFREAARRDMPVFLSVGYSSCHWCHVMERESFRNREIADLLNNNFINIKVDREERPDIDAVYMGSLQTLTGVGGWPMNLFLTPEAKPYFGGTYFPPEERHGLPSFANVIEGAASIFRNDRNKVEEEAARVIDRLEEAMLQPPGAEITGNISESAVENYFRIFDDEKGGFTSAPKFPQPSNLDFLLRYNYRTGNSRAMEMVRLTIDRMAAGGIRDHLGGGFHRYSTDEDWLIPHFEKMLYDNALTARLYTRADRATGERRYGVIAEETIDYVLGELHAPEGGFYASQDAESREIEGEYYLWTPGQIRHALGENDGDAFCLAYGVTDEGNCFGRNILSGPSGDEGNEKLLAKCRKRLLVEREKREKPAVDRKVIAGWNGLMIATLAEASLLLRKSDYRKAAISAAEFLTETMMKDGRLARTWNGGATGRDGCLEDYAFCADGLLALYRATGEERWFRSARDLADAIVDRNLDTGRGGFYDTANDHEELITRTKTIQDSAAPSGNAAAVGALLQVAALTGEERYSVPARTALGNMHRHMSLYPVAFGEWLCALESALSPLRTVAIAGEPEKEETLALLEVALGEWRPGLAVVYGQPEESAVPILKGKETVRGAATAYLCEDRRCEAPITDPGELKKRLDRRD